MNEPRHIALEQPDLLLHRGDPPEIRFVECKLDYTGDTLNARQRLGFMLITAVLRLPVDVVVVVEKGKQTEKTGAELRFAYPPASA